MQLCFCRCNLSSVGGATVPSGPPAEWGMESKYSSSHRWKVLLSGETLVDFFNLRLAGFVLRKTTWPGHEKLLWILHYNEVEQIGLSSLVNTSVSKYYTAGLLELIEMAFHNTRSWHFCRTTPLFVIIYILYNRALSIQPFLPILIYRRR